MPYSIINNTSNGSDMDKLYTALHDVLASFGSGPGLLHALGLADLPVAHQYGLVLGGLVFLGTVGTVLVLLWYGGSFERIQIQAVTGAATILSAGQARNQRALLYDQLLVARQRMVDNYGGNNDKNHNQQSHTATAENSSVSSSSSSSSSPLLQLLLNQAPSKVAAVVPPDLLVVDRNGNNNDVGGRVVGDENQKPAVVDHLVQLLFKQPSSLLLSKQGGPPPPPRMEQFVPHGYKEDYVKAYRRCQDRPGGPVLSGRPEARYEAYARAYAGCGASPSHLYKCSYARQCELQACRNHDDNDRHNWLFDHHPDDLLGRYLRLARLDAQRHVRDLFSVTTGTALAGYKSFDPQEIWAFLPEGPFAHPSELEQSFLFRSYPQHNHSAAFAMIDMVTDALIGVIRLTNDDPHNLSVQLEPPIVPPHYRGGKKQLEACFLLLDRLFALGYRRIQLSIDTQDIENQQLAKRLKCPLEGILRKHGVVKDANRDSKIYSLINSDWKASVRVELFGTLYGTQMLSYDQANEAFETEQEDKEDFAQREKLMVGVVAVTATVTTPQQDSTKKFV